MCRDRVVIVAIAMLWWLSASSMAATGQLSDHQVPILKIPRVSQPPTMEDFVLGRTREAEIEVSEFRQLKPGDGVPATRETRAYLSYDQTTLYVVFVCKDDPRRIRAHVARREDIESDDHVAVYLDTFQDRRDAYVFAVNPLGVEFDGYWTGGQGVDPAFDTVWYSAGRLVSDGFIVWMAIPFKSLRFPPAPTQQWGIAVGRVIRRNGEESYWPFITQRLESAASQFATLEGLEHIATGHHVQFIPYAAASTARILDPDVNGGAVLRTNTELRAGVDAKMVVRDAMAIDATLRPDSSQVESDEPQVTVNQRFEVFFPEKRPFFTENASTLQTPTNLFFSRRIQEPQLGVRLTANVGVWTVGVLAIDDQQNVVSGDEEERSRAAIGVGRLQREFTNESTVGVLVTGRDDGLSSNKVGSVDTRIKLGSNWVLSGQAIRSWSVLPDGSHANGAASWAEILRSGRHLVYATRYTDRSPDFRAELGFVPRVDLRLVEEYVRYYWRPEHSAVQVIGPEITIQSNWDYAGRIQERVVDASFGMDVRGPVSVGCRYVKAFEVFQTLGFHRHKADCGISAAWLKWLDLKADYGWGTSVNYTPSPDLAAFLAASSSASVTLTLRPSPGTRIDLSYLFDALRTNDFSDIDRPVGSPIFDDNIFRTKIAYQLTRALSFRGIVDYHAIGRDPTLVALEHAKRLTADVLLTYLVHPGTALYLGYTDTYENIEPDFPWRARTGSLRMSTGRQVFVKVGYLFRF